MRSTHGHGGSAVYVRNSLASEVKVLRLNGDSDRDWIWLAVCGVSCCFAYAPPPNSVAIVDEEDPLLTIYGEAAVYALSGPVVILGDLNARTGSLSTDLPSVPRASMDPSVSSRGRLLLDLSKDADMLVLNGCDGYGDPEGRITNFHSRGSSVVDYVVVSETLAVPGCSMAVLNPQFDSFHCPIRLTVVSSRFGYSPAFYFDHGVVQGDPLSPTLFAIFLADLWFPSGADSPSLMGTKVPCLMLADDIALFAHSEAGLQALLDSLVAFCSRWRLLINGDKSKVLTFPGRRTRSAPLRVFTSRDAPPLEVVEEFEYVGVTVSATRAWSSKSHCRKAIAKARHTLFSLALVEPYLIYGVVVTFNGPFHAEYDMLHRTAMRIATGVSPRSITAPLFYDLAELPFFDRRTVLLAGYFDYLRALPPGRLAHEAFLSSQRLAEQGHRGWYSVARDRFQQLGIDLTQAFQSLVSSPPPPPPPSLIRLTGNIPQTSPLHLPSLCPGAGHGEVAGGVS
ncbi:hypothetical protein G7K_4593-t1 [Saitoella complicata NRRL Y-17804]|uniref:Reverse transcriptase domain-containing protein n=1 Tax=Saitoella complicata (strain BCRC 22490 / CBS 7301 / JCM 7358 / NBRC 10748 / NRRL Y-17804) TaxID=698492 RepID=A0A0E9NKV6_SAICN|nr:hypothetical protein G7K_4593-t1 [Saitoella complicata NRRL Y-17804]